MKIVFAIITLFASLNTHAQSRTVNGLVLNEKIFPLWYVSIYINDWDKVGDTDSNGKYEITLPVGVDSITFKGVGYEPLLVKLTPECSHVEVIMILAGTNDFMSPEKSDRHRRRDFNKVNKLYPVAVEKDLFRLGTPCHKLIFQPNAPEMRKKHRQRLRKHHSAQQQL